MIKNPNPRIQALIDRWHAADEAVAAECALAAADWGGYTVTAGELMRTPVLKCGRNCVYIFRALRQVAEERGDTAAAAHWKDAEAEARSENLYGSMPFTQGVGS